MISPTWVSVSPNTRYIRNIGIATTTGGSMRVDRMKNSQSCSPATLKRENPYAVSVPMPTASTVEDMAMISEFMKRSG